MAAADTIVALASGALPAGVAVLRISGPLAEEILTEILGNLPVPRRLTLSNIALNGQQIDRGLCAWMPGPASFTGEDCAELHVHGSPAVVRGLLRGLTEKPGVRLAEAGEFTRRALENGKLNLVEAQGLGDLIAAETENQRALAHMRMEGGLTRQVEGWRVRLLDLRAQIEAQLDFSDEDDVGALPETFRAEVLGLHGDISRVVASVGQGRVLRSGFRAVLAGPPNAGKSSLLNALSKSDAAIVSDEPGTTRDLKEVPLDVGGQLVILVDSAGIRQTESRAESMGVERARSAMLGADLVIWLISPDQPRADLPEFPELEDEQRLRPPVLRVGTKFDIGLVRDVDHAVSVVTDQGVDELVHLLGELSGGSGVDAGTILVSHERDRIALHDAELALSDAEGQLDSPELAAENLRLASSALERLLGRMDSEAVLDRLFSAFCIGK